MILLFVVWFISLSSHIDKLPLKTQATRSNMNHQAALMSSLLALTGRRLGLVQKELGRRQWLGLDARWGVGGMETAMGRESWKEAET